METKKTFFDSQITISQLITGLVPLLVLVVGAYISLRMDINTNGMRIDRVEEKQTEFKEFFVEMKAENKEIKTIVQQIQLDLAKK